jgi:type III pantothenate kinase
VWINWKYGMLLIDFGNSRIKLARSEGGHITQLAAIAHGSGEWFAQLERVLHDEAAPEQILLAATGPELLLGPLCAWLQERWPLVPLRRAQSLARMGRLQIAYSAPQRLGIDRFLALLAASAAEQDLLLVSVGTAVTVDLLAANGHHLGGLIAPSAETMRAALIARTARVHWLAEGKRVDFAANTEDALYSGCAEAALGLIRHASQAACLRLGARPQLWAHGGGAEALLTGSGLDFLVQDELVQRGLLLWANQNDSTRPD